MHSNSHSDQSNTGAGHPMPYVSTRVLRIQLPLLHIAICGPGENADCVPGQLPFGKMHTPNKTGNESAGH
jgi:hypothetical protein